MLMQQFGLSSDLPLAAEYCDRLIILSEGKVAADGAPRDVMTPSLLQNVFRLSAEITERDGVLDLRLRPLSAL